VFGFLLLKVLFFFLDELLNLLLRFCWLSVIKLSVAFAVLQCKESNRNFSLVRELFLSW